MALQAKLGSFNTGTGAVGSTLAISGVGFQPKYCVFWYTGSASTTDAAVRGDARIGYGAFDADGGQRFIAAVIQDNLASSNSASSRDADGVIALAGPAVGIAGKLSLQSIGTDGFTLVVSTQMTADIRVHYLALGGPELQVKIGTLSIATGATGNQSVTGLTFQPTMVHLWGGWQTAINISGAPFYFGAMMSGTKQAAGAWSSRDGRPSAEARRYLYNGEALAAINATNALDFQASYVSMNTDGFTIGVTNSPGNTITSWYTAFGGVDMDMGILNTQMDTTTDIVVSGLGFTPAAGLLVSAGIAQPTQGTPYNYITFSMGAFTDVNTQRVMGARDNQGADPTSVMYSIDHDAVYNSIAVTGDTMNASMHLTSVDSGGFTARMTDAEDIAQSQVLWIVWGNVVQAGDQTINVPDLTEADAFGVPRVRSEVVTVDTTTSHQTLRGVLSAKAGLYSANRERPQLGTVNGHPVASAYANGLNAINDLLIDAGVWQMRVEVDPYVMHNHSYFADWLADTSGTVVLTDYTSDFLEGVGYVWDSIDYLVETAFLPLRDRMRLSGRVLKFQLCFVNFRLSSEPSTLNQKMFDSSTRWATLIKDTYIHLRDTYGLIPDTYDVILEPNTNVEGAAATAAQIAAGMQAMVTQLAAEGIMPRFIVPSDVTTLGSYNIWNSLRSTLGDSFCSTYVTEISYHRYGSPSLTHIQSFASQADALGIGTAMTEFMGADIDMLVEDLIEGKGTTWEQFSIINTTPDSGGTLLLIDDSVPATPVVWQGSRTRLIRQVFHFLSPETVRKAASATASSLKPLAFTTRNGQTVVAVRATGEMDFWISGLPDGRYRLEYATTAGPVDAGTATVSSGSKIAATIPAAGVLTVYTAGVYPYSIFTEDEFGSPTVSQIDNSDGSLSATLGGLSLSASGSSGGAGPTPSAPSTAVLDNFNRADGSPGASWGSPLWPLSETLQVVSNQIVARVFSPTDIANLVLHLDAMDLSSLFQDTAGTQAVTANGQRIARWSDLSGSGNHLTQATTANRAYYTESGINGLRSVRFDPTASEWNHLVSPSFFDANYNTALTIFVVLGNSTQNNYRVALSVNDTRTVLGEDYDTAFFNTSQLTVPASQGGTATRSGAQQIAGNVRVVGISYDGSTLRTIVNGHACQIPATGSLGLSGALTVGNLSTAGNANWRGDIGEIYIWRTAASLASMRLIHRYLMAKWNLPQPRLKAVVYAGDSLTAGTGSADNRGFPGILASSVLGNTALSHHNTGIGGAGIAYLDDTVAPAQVDTRLDLSLNNSICVVWMGTNDVSQTSGDATATYNLFRDYCANRYAAGFQKVIVATMLPRSDPSDSPNTETRRQAFNSLIRSNYASFADALADVAADTNIGEAGDETNTTYYGDRVHLTGAGYAIVASIIGSAIQGVL